jgi:hypothetical protein
MWIGEHLFTVI